MIDLEKLKTAIARIEEAEKLLEAEGMEEFAWALKDTRNEVQEVLDGEHVDYARCEDCGAVTGDVEEMYWADSGEAFCRACNMKRMEYWACDSTCAYCGVETRCYQFRERFACPEHLEKLLGGEEETK